LTTANFYGGNSESVGLYGNTNITGGTYFQWFVFQISATAPATPTGGSWSFSTNTGTAPTGWSSDPPSAPTNLIWSSFAIVDSRSSSSLTWSVPGQFAYSSGAGLPILINTNAPGSGDGVSNQLYVQTNTTPQTVWVKESTTWVQLTGSSIYLTVLGGVSGGTF